jgi:hypothetical protein
VTVYAELAGVSLEVVKEFGAPVTFVRSTPGTYDEATDTWTSPTETTVSGQAIQTRGQAETYEHLSLTESEAPTLLFVPNEYGARPKPGDTCRWASRYGLPEEGEDFAVVDVQPVAPDGKAILARVVVRRGGGG